MINNFNLSGRIVADPKIIKLDSGKEMGVFMLAINKFYKDENQENQKKTDFFDLSTFQPKMMEYLTKKFKKGDFVSVVGTISIFKKESKKELFLNLNKIQKLTSSNKKESIINDQNNESLNSNEKDSLHNEDIVQDNHENKTFIPNILKNKKSSTNLL